MESKIRTVPFIDCHGNIGEMSTPGGARFFRKDCRLHGSEIYRCMTVSLNNTTIRKTAVVDIYLSEDFKSEVKDRNKLL